ncbi:hypothetical protein AVEN_31842-1 [Araneus ventricosus]|uniref:Gustatory receptor n=1 Tax=Araneus ventricosus TaxID=182803 RepID=A0A4Y2L5T8_ARAVE|nr:hypothetical protein AVEN_31842-1 [Araneus ventricosus]
MQIYAITSWSLLFAQEVSTVRELISFFVSNLLSLVLWHDVKRKRHLIKSLVLKHQGSEIHLETKKNHVSVIINICLTAIVLIQVVLTVLCVYLLFHSSVEYRKYFSLLMDIENGNVASIIITAMIIFMTYTVLLKLPALIAVLAGTLYYKCSELLANVSKSMEDMRCLVPQYREIFKIFQNYNELFKMVNEVEETFSSTSFLVLCSQWINLYLVLVTYFKIEDRGFSTAVSWECFARLILGSLTVVGVVLCASRISSQVRRIQTSLQLIHNSLMKDEEKNRRVIEVVKSMIDMEFPQMTAYGFVELKPEFIFSAFGSVLTYGLLVLNLKKE